MRERLIETVAERGVHWHEETVESYGGEYRLVDIRPETLVSEVPVLVAPGFSEDPTVLQDALLEIAASGRRVICVDHPRRGNIEDAQGLDASPLTVRKAVTVLDAMDRKGIDCWDVVAHSEGAVYAAYAAKLRPGSIRNLVLVAPAGLDGEPSIFRLGGRFVRKAGHIMARGVRDRSARRNVVRSQVRGSAFIARNPKKAIGEGVALTHASIGHLLCELDAEGVGVAVLQSNHDRMFPPRVIGPRVPEAVTYASVADEEAAHDELFLNARLAARGAVELLDGLEHRVRLDDA